MNASLPARLPLAHLDAAAAAHETRWAPALIVLIAHAGVLAAMALQTPTTPPRILHAAPVIARLISPEPPAPAPAAEAAPPEPAPPEPPVEPPAPQPEPLPAPTPVTAPAVERTPVATPASPPPRPRPQRAAPKPARATPAPRPAPAAPAPVVAAPAQAEAAAPVVAARFDAAYLRNPPPAYPALSRSNGESGRVLLRVRVSAKGEPESVELAAGSGHARLDEAALAAVRRWRFVPARQGERAIAATVTVPIIFKLEK